VPSRGPGGDPKSSLGGPRTAREVAGYNINHSRIAARASCSKRARAFAIRAGIPGGPSAPYSAKPRCAFLSFNRRAGMRGRHAGFRIIAFIVSTVLRSFFGIRKQKARRSLRLSGLRGEFLAGDDEVYPWFLPECGRFAATRLSVSHAMREPSAQCAWIGSRLKVALMEIGSALSGET